MIIKSSIMINFPICVFPRLGFSITPISKQI